MSELRVKMRDMEEDFHRYQDCQYDTEPNYKLPRAVKFTIITTRGKSPMLCSTDSVSLPKKTFRQIEEIKESVMSNTYEPPGDSVDESLIEFYEEFKNVPFKIMMSSIKIPFAAFFLFKPWCVPLPPPGDPEVVATEKVRRALIDLKRTANRGIIQIKFILALTSPNKRTQLEIDALANLQKICYWLELLKIPAFTMYESYAEYLVKLIKETKDKLLRNEINKGATNVTRIRFFDYNE